MLNAEWFKLIEEITNPKEMVRELVNAAHDGFLGVPVPYYKDIRKFILAAAEKMCVGIHTQDCNSRRPPQMLAVGICKGAGDTHYEPWPCSCGCQ